MLFLMFNEKYLWAAIMKSCYPDPLVFFSLLCYVTFKSSFARQLVLFYTIVKAYS